MQYTSTIPKDSVASVFDMTGSVSISNDTPKLESAKEGKEIKVGAPS